MGGGGGGHQLVPRCADHHYLGLSHLTLGKGMRPQYTSYEGLNLTNPKSRKLEVLHRKLVETTTYFIVMLTHIDT